MAKRGRKSLYDPRFIQGVIEYTNNCKKNDKLPTIEELATIFSVGVRTLYDWEESHDEFSHAIQQLRETQKYILINNALTGQYNARFATFLLKASHGYKENEPVITSSENYMNISPEVLADAIKLMRSSG